MTTLTKPAASDVRAALAALAAAYISAASGCLRGLPDGQLFTAARAAGQLAERLDAEIGRRDPTAGTLVRVLADVRAERASQDAQWGSGPAGTVGAGRSPAGRG